MAVSEIVVANAALWKLGEPPVLGFDDNNERARALKARFRPVRDALIRSHTWHFAMARASLAASPTAPPWGYQFQYQAPTDLLRLVQVNDYMPVDGLEDYRTGSQAPYAFEGRRILTDYAAPLLIRYVRLVEDTTAWDPLFVAALESKLAYELCEKISQSGSKKQGLAAEFRDAIKEARAANAIETGSEPRDDGSWVMSRL